jgi:hypothetical protein
MRRQRWPAACRRRELEVTVEPTPQGMLPPEAEHFMHGRLRGLLKTCGYELMPPEYLEAAREQQGRHGLDVHVPPYAEVPCQARARCAALPRLHAAALPRRCVKQRRRASRCPRAWAHVHAQMLCQAVAIHLPGM